MRTKVTLVLVFLNVALFFFIFKFERNWRTERASLEARRRVLGPPIIVQSARIAAGRAGARFGALRCVLARLLLFPPLHLGPLEEKDLGRVGDSADEALPELLRVTRAEASIVHL